MKGFIKKAAAVLASTAIMFSVAAYAIVPHASAAETSRLGELIVLDNLFSGDGVRGGNVSRLGELIVLDNLFMDGNGSGTRTSRLGELIVLDNLFSGDGVRGGNVSRLGELIVLDNLFPRD